MTRAERMAVAVRAHVAVLGARGPGAPRYDAVRALTDAMGVPPYPPGIVKTMYAVHGHEVLRWVGCSRAVWDVAVRSALAEDGRAR